MDIGAWIKAARAARGWTQVDLAEKVGTSKANLSHWETGKHEPSFGQLLRIRDVTGHPLREVEPDRAWPFPAIPRERITSLSPSQLLALQSSMLAALALITEAPSHVTQSGKLPPLVA
jgi:transcriptional regulator with XRE-family HTH domain